MDAEELRGVADGIAVAAQATVGVCPAGQLASRVRVDVEIAREALDGSLAAFSSALHPALHKKCEPVLRLNLQSFTGPSGCIIPQTLGAVAGRKDAKRRRTEGLDVQRIQCVSDGRFWVVRPAVSLRPDAQHANVLRAASQYFCGVADGIVDHFVTRWLKREVAP